MTNARTSTEERALTLLGSGLGAEVVANAVGVSVSRISQLLSDPEFTAQVSELRFNSLQKHNDRDNKYDTMESKLLDTLENLLPLMMRPMEILKAIAVLNGAKRRGQSAPESITGQQTIVNIMMPTKIVQNFTVNSNNQVVTAGTQELLTIQSANMESMSRAALARKVNILENSNENTNSRAGSAIEAAKARAISA